LAFVDQTSSAIYTFADSSSELSRSTRCTLWLADLMSLYFVVHRPKLVDVAELSKRIGEREIVSIFTIIDFDV
jgi:hypothetical protein